MFINILDVDAFIKDHGWLEVKTPNYFVPNSSENHPEGLLSDIIFGKPGTPDRKRLWGYVELNCVLMIPHAFYVLTRLKVNIAEDMKSEIGNYYVDKTGELVKLELGETVPETALTSIGSGFSWLRSVWDKISWKTTKNMTKTAIIRRKFLKSLSKSEAFITRYPIMPAFYRDVDYANQLRNEINDFYIRLIHYTEMIKNTDTFIIDTEPDTPRASAASIKMMDLIMEIYTTFVLKMGSANGFTNDFVAGKATDYGARLVISTPDYNTERYTDIEADFFHSSVPLAVAVNIFAPFMINGLIEWINNIVAGKTTISYYDHIKNEFVNKTLSLSFMEEYTSEEITTILNLYKRSKKFRTKIVTLKADDGSDIPLQYIFGLNQDNKSIVELTMPYLGGELDSGEDIGKHIRNISWVELLYMIAYQKLSDKCIQNTRYPVADYNGTYSGYMNLIPSTRHIGVYINGEYYPRFPIITAKTSFQKEHMFIDTMRMFSVYPSALGADFDGDQISTQSVFTEDAKEDCDRYMHSLVNVIGLNGKIIREFPHVTEHGIYGLTYKIPKPTK